MADEDKIWTNLITLVITFFLNKDRNFLWLRVQQVTFKDLIFKCTVFSDTKMLLVGILMTDFILPTPLWQKNPNYFFYKYKFSINTNLWKVLHNQSQSDHEYSLTFRSNGKCGLRLLYSQSSNSEISVYILSGAMQHQW